MLKACSFMVGAHEEESDTSDNEYLDEISFMPRKMKQNLGDLQIGQIVRCYFTIKQELFDSDSFLCTFNAEYDPRTEKQLVMEFSKQNFVDLDNKLEEVDMESKSCFSLEKFAAS